LSLDSLSEDREEENGEEEGEAQISKPTRLETEKAFDIVKRFFLTEKDVSDVCFKNLAQLEREFQQRKTKNNKQTLITHWFN